MIFTIRLCVTSWVLHMLLSSWGYALDLIFDLILLGTQCIQITIKTHNNEIHLHERYNKSTKNSPKSLLKWKLNSIGVLNIGTQCQSKDKIKKQRPAQKTLKLSFSCTTLFKLDNIPTLSSSLWPIMRTGPFSHNKTHNFILNDLKLVFILLRQGWVPRWTCIIRMTHY